MIKISFEWSDGPCGRAADYDYNSIIDINKIECEKNYFLHIKFQRTAMEGIDGIGITATEDGPIVSSILKQIASAFHIWTMINVGAFFVVIFVVVDTFV